MFSLVWFHTLTYSQLDWLWCLGGRLLSHHLPRLR